MTKVELINAVLDKADIPVSDDTRKIVIHEALKRSKKALEMGYAQVDKQYFNPARVIDIVAVWTHGFRIDFYVPASVESKRISWI